MHSMRKLLIIDGYNFLFRAYHAMPQLTNPAGVPIGAVHGFINILFKYFTQEDFDYIVVALDAGVRTFRSDVYEEYKKNRSEAPDPLVPQFDLARQAIAAFDICALTMPGYEADDIIATSVRFAENQGIHSTILSSDKDLMQLISDTTIIIDPIKNIDITPEYVMEKFGVSHIHLLNFFALVGDTSDNIPGVKGIGPKTASGLINQYPSLEAIYQNIDQIESIRVRNLLLSGRDSAFLSRHLIALKEDIDIDLNDFTKKKIDLEKLTSFLNTHGLKSILLRVEKQFNYTMLKKQSHGVINIINNESDLGDFLDYCAKKGQIIITKHEDMIGIAASEDEAAETFSINRECMGNIFMNDSILKITDDYRMMRKEFGSFVALDDIALMEYANKTGKYIYTCERIASDYELNYSSAGEKAMVIAQLYIKIQQELLRNGLLSLYYNIDRHLPSIVSEMEETGINIDRTKLEHLLTDFTIRIDRISNEIFGLAGSEFNIGSPQQLGDMLFEKLMLPVPKKRTKMGYSTGVDVLERLVSDGHDIAEKILEWRRLSKLKNTYIEKLLDLTKEKDSIHTEFSISGTSTGRFSSSNPNLQNIPIKTEDGRKIRGCFVPRNGYQLVSFDYSQMELRILAQIANVTSLLDSFSKGMDIHSLAANKIFGNSDQDSRRRAKAINFGVIYGISGFGLAKQLKIDRVSANKYIDAYFNEYPEIKKYMTDIVEIARSQGYVETLFGRRCYIDDINSSNHTLRNFAERAAINAPIQGTAADIIRDAMVKFSRMKSDNCRMLLQIHDELVFEIYGSTWNELDGVLLNHIIDNMKSSTMQLRIDTKLWYNY